ncbi:glycine receptor subunit alphaZ1-like [Oppia nitens]|uniref:glycine receptor subunit alphaZ1-like n=1 Tax=Oppia nitens TaxID=1686743 RepID=UPI0023DB20E9|nr:glycine receptor subunit alphaZ1-like [Oppia nitens]
MIVSFEESIFESALKSTLKSYSQSKDNSEDNKNGINGTEDVPKTAEELSVDKEQIKRIPIYINMDYRVDFYYKQQWLAMKPDCQMYKNSMIGRNISLVNVSQSDKLIINKEYFTLFWIPDIMISNAKEVKQQSELIETILLQIHFVGNNNEDCYMEYLGRYYSIVSCPMDFRDVPIDLQKCSIQMRSFAFNEDRIQLNWSRNVEFNPDLRLLEHDFEITQERITTEIFKETYSLLKIKIEFQRKIANKLVGIYTPSFIIVLITFCTFWLGITAVSERVTIGITALLALVTQFNEVRQSLPPTSYTTEIDHWMIMCIVMVAAQLVQCTIVDFVYHRQQHQLKVKKTQIDVINRFRKSAQNKQIGGKGLKAKKWLNLKVNANRKPNSWDDMFKTKAAVYKPPNNDNNNNLIVNKLSKIMGKLLSVPVGPDKSEYLPMRIDAVSRILFPMTFAIICIFYWPLMLSKAF